MRADVPYRCLNHVVQGQGQTSGLIPKCCLPNIICMSQVINQRQTINYKPNDCSTSKVVAYFPIEPCRQDSN